MILGRSALARKPLGRAEPLSVVAQVVKRLLTLLGVGI